MKEYLTLVNLILENGTEKQDRTGTGVLSLFGTQSRYNLAEGFPLLTTKKVVFSSVVHELLWFLSGSTDVNDLSSGTKIWNNWADAEGNLGPIYGYQWRHWERFSWNPQTNKYDKDKIDQISNAIQIIKTDPSSRRIIVNAWNVADLEKMKLPPCHLVFQFYVLNGRLDCQVYQRSADIALGVPFNIASYALLMMMFAQECDLQPGFLIHTLGDAHIYLNHIDKIKEQIKREPLYPLPCVKIKKKPFSEITFDDIELQNYKSHPFIKFDISV